MKLSQYIKKQQQKVKTFNKRMKTFALEVEGQFKDNIGKDRITPKTNKSKGSTLFDKGIGLRGIKTIASGS